MVLDVTAPCCAVVVVVVVVMAMALLLLILSQCRIQFSVVDFSIVVQPLIRVDEIC